MCWKIHVCQSTSGLERAKQANISAKSITLITLLSGVFIPQADHPLCLRPRDVRLTIRYLISYIFCNLLRLSSDWFNWSRKMLNKILDFASFDTKLWSTVSQINKVHLRIAVCVVFFGLMGFWVRSFLASCCCPLQVLSLPLEGAATASEELTDPKAHQTPAQCNTGVNYISWSKYAVGLGYL